MLVGHWMFDVVSHQYTQYQARILARNVPKGKASS